MALSVEETEELIDDLNEYANSSVKVLEQAVVLVSRTKDGENVIQFPLTRLRQIEDIKDLPQEDGGLEWDDNMKLYVEASDLLKSSQGAFEQDTNRLLQNQRNDTWSQYVNQVNYENQANTYSTMASNAKSSGIINALGTLAAGSASFFGSGSGNSASKPTTVVSNVPLSVLKKKTKITNSNNGVIDVGNDIWYQAW